MPLGRLHAIILAGGSGTRFWPLSRELMPKQLLNIVGDRSMLALTHERVKGLVPDERIWVVTTCAQAGLIRRELLDQGAGNVRVLDEPAGRNTAAAIGLAAVHVLKEDPGATMAVFPADHNIKDQARFTDRIREAHELAEKGWLVTLGIKPERPETGYGYIEKSDPLSPETSGDASVQAFRVARFTEKPDLDKAREYVETGNYYWNSGIFIWKADVFMEEVQKNLPEHHQGLDRIAALIHDPAQKDKGTEEIYVSLPSISVDYGIMEVAERVAVIPADMGWSDVGSWEALRDIIGHDEQGNILQGNVMTVDTKNTFIRTEDRLVAALGVEGLVVVDTADALLVCQQDRSQEVKKIAEKLREDKRDEALVHLKVNKPWGGYRVIDGSDHYQVKWLDVNPGHRLSLQSHEHRSEHWTVVQGTATVTLEDRVMEVPCGDHVFIPVRSRHRLENRAKEGTLRVIEVQTGDDLGEDDIVRYEDDYDRIR